MKLTAEQSATALLTLMHRLELIHPGDGFNNNRGLLFLYSDSVKWREKIVRDRALRNMCEVRKTSSET